MAPAGTPDAIVDRIADTVQHLLKSDALIRSLVNIGVDPVGDSPQEFAAVIAMDVQRWAEAVRVAVAHPK
jgi:tripartite-type tricarboxylate transporter receptor subunit TctC